MDRSNIKILVVDDVPDNVKILLSILKEEGVSLSFSFSGEEAVAMCERERFDLILLDIMMPVMSGFETCKQIKKSIINEKSPIIFISARTDVESISKGFSLGAVDYIVKPFHPDEILARVNTHLSLSIAQRQLAQNIKHLNRQSEFKQKRLLDEIELSQREMIYVLMEMMELTSDETGQHIRRVAESAQLLAHYSTQLDEDDESIIFHASPMHDIGKIAIPSEILHKPGKLTPEEFEVMKTHTTKALNFFPNTKRRLINAASIIAVQHHEKWDGSGYPAGLEGENIHIYGRIVALADVFDALTHKRKYKEAWTVKDALIYIKEGQGKHFDPVLVDILFDHLDEFLEIIERHQTHEVS